MQPKEYINLTYSLTEEQFDIAVAALADLPFFGITEGFDEMTICFLKNDVNDEFLAEIQESFRNFGITATLERSEIVVEENWNEQWEQSIEPVIISERIAIAPEWKRDLVSQEITVIINPKMSFGTGHHQTTRMVALFLEKLVRPYSHWTDAGTGTGALAIVAVKLGAGNVFAFDNDEWSIENAIENVRMNGAEERITVEQANVYTVDIPDCDGIAANLHRNLLEGNIQKFYHALHVAKGDLIVSGILRFDVEEVVAFAEKAGFTHRETMIDGDWAAIHFVAV